MRLMKTLKKKAGKPRLKASSSSASVVGRCAASTTAVLAAWAAAMWIAVPFAVFAMSALKSDPATFSTAVSSYVETSLLRGWSAIAQVPHSGTPAIVLSTLLTVAALLLAMHSVSEGLTPSVLKNIFGPAASSGNEKGSARLFANELQLALLTETWRGDWGDPPAYAAPVVGYSPTFGYYLAPPESHTVAFGITGSGKTTSLNYCSLDALVAGGASVVVTDPKGELYDATGPTLREKGVEVRIIDFRNPERSECINPLAPITRAFGEHNTAYREWSERALEIVREAGVDARRAHDLSAWEGRRGLYEEYLSALRTADNERAKAWSKAEESALDLAGAIIPDRPDAGAAAHWEQVARLLLQSLALFVGTYVEEDYADLDTPAYTEPLPEQRTLEAIHYLLSEHGGATDKGKELEEILGKLDRRHPAWKAFAQARQSDAKEYRTAVAETIKFLAIILNMSLNRVLNRSDLDLGDMGERQMVLYIVIPDDRPMVGKLFATLVTQAYQELIPRALKNGLRLPVPVHFILEEVGNLAVPIPELPQKLAMGRGYGIYFHLTLQDMEQLPARYGKYGQSTIMSNCGVRMLIKTNDAQVTGRYFSENMGKYTYVSRRLTRSRGVLGLLDTSASASSSESERPMMYPDELTRWDPSWGSIVLMNKPGKEPGALVRLLFGYQTMMPCVFPREAAWNTETAENLEIGSREEMAAKAALAEAESRLATRTPNAVWEPRRLTARERANLEQSLVPGGISPTASEDFRRFSASREARPYVLDYISTRVTKEMLFEGGPDAIDDIADDLKKAYKEELRKGDEALDRKAPGYDHDAVVRARKVKLAAADALVFELLSAALRDGDATLLATEPRAVEPPPAEVEPEGGVETAPSHEAARAKPKAGRGKAPRSRDKDWIDDIRKALKKPYKQAGTLEEFLELACAAGVAFEESGPGYSCRLKGRKQTISASKVGRKYSREALEKRYAATAGKPKE